MIFEDQPPLRRLLVIGTPLLTGILLLFHPIPDQAAMEHAEHSGVMDVFALLAPIANAFLLVHVLFAPLLALLGLAVVALLNGVRGVAATISHVSAFVFVVSYIVYESIIGTATGLLVRGGAALPLEEQAAISDAVNRIMRDPVLGDGPSALFLIATLSWPMAVITAGFALRRAGKPLLPCILLGLSSVFTFHASPLGPLGMLLFLFAAVNFERAGSAVMGSQEFETMPST